MQMKLFFDNNPRLSIVVVLCLFAIIAISPQLDIYVSGLFFNDNHFMFKNNIIFKFVDVYFPYFVLVISSSIGLFWLIGFLNFRKWVLGINTRIMLFLCGSMFVGPILIVNGFFKSLWGRARPKDIIEFGGDKMFSPAMVVSNQCHLDCSFVSGHTSVGFWFVAIALLMPTKYRFTSVILAFILGIFVGFARIAEGYHFFSDVVFSAVITLYVIWIMYYYIKPNSNQV